MNFNNGKIRSILSKASNPITVGVDDYFDELNEKFEGLDFSDKHCNHPLDTNSNILNKNVIKYLKWKGSQKYYAEGNLYFMSTNVLCKCEADYIPIEIAIVEYNLNEAILRTFHRFVHPTTVPIGYMGQALRHRDKTHKIPVGDWLDVSSDDFEKVLDDITDFIGFDMSRTTSSQFCNPFMICNGEQIKQNRRVLKYICDQAAIARGDISEGAKNFKSKSNLAKRIAILNVIDFSQIATGSVGCRDLYFSIKQAFEKTVYDLSSDTDCLFHQNVESNICALGAAKRLSFLASDYLCPIMGVDIELGKHTPLL